MHGLINYTDCECQKAKVRLLLHNLANKVTPVHVVNLLYLVHRKAHNPV